MCNLIETFHKLAKEEYDMRAVLKKIIQEKANTLTEVFKLYVELKQTLIKNSN